MEEQNFIENEIIIFSKATIDKFLQYENCSDLISVYTFYYYTAKWQKTNQPKCTNEYVKKALHISSVRLVKAKELLESLKLITQVVTKSKTGKVTGWYIKLNYIWSKSTEQEIVKTEEKPEVIFTTSGNEETNALSTNNINALNTNNILPSSKIEGLLPENRGKNPIQRVVSIYCDLFRSLYGIRPDFDFKKDTSLIKRLLVRYSEIQVAAMLITYFDWKGMDDGDEYERKRLVNATHPFSWFYSGVSRYEIYLRNVYKLDFDNEQSVREFVAKVMIKLNESTI